MTPAQVVELFAPGLVMEDLEAVSIGVRDGFQILCAGEGGRHQRQITSGLEQRSEEIRYPRGSMREVWVEIRNVARHRPLCPTGCRSPRTDKLTARGESERATRG